MLIMCSRFYDRNYSAGTDFQERLCFFLLLSFTTVCFARQFPLENEKTLFPDYDPPHNHNRPPPPLDVSTSLSNNEKTLFPDYDPPHNHNQPPPPLDVSTTSHSS
uniref:Uncharacterized protein n=1 Tax=Quercus lobata TaxID=97700 RepID=A0A7N2KNE4_QUELO